VLRSGRDIERYWALGGSFRLKASTEDPLWRL